MFAFALWDEARQHAVLRARPLRHQAALLHESATASSTSPPRRRRCCRSCRTIETDSTAFKDYLTFQFCLGGKTLFEGIQRAAARALACAVRNGDGRDAPLLGGQYELDFDHSRRVLRSADCRSCSTTRSRCICAPTCRSARTSAAASTRASSRSLASTSTARDCRASPASSSSDPGYDESATRGTSPTTRGLRAARARHHRRATSSTHRRRHLPPRLSGRGARLVPAVHGLGARGAGTSRSCSAARAATRSSAATRAT